MRQAEGSRQAGRERGFLAQTNKQTDRTTHPPTPQAGPVCDGYSGPGAVREAGSEGRNSDTSLLSIVVVPLDQPVLAWISLLFARNTQYARHAIPEYYIQAAAYVP